MPNLERSDRYYAIVLAAGSSTRMGICKAGLPWLEGKTLLSYQIEQFLTVGITPIVVLAPHNVDRKQNCPPECIVAINPCPIVGKTSSILAGLQHLPRSVEVVAISAVDQPRPCQVYQRLLQAHLAPPEAVITAPAYRGRLGHPLFFARKLLPILENLREETAGMRQVVQEFHSQIRRVEFDTPEVTVDLNTPEVYRAQLLALSLNSRV